MKRLIPWALLAAAIAAVWVVWASRRTDAAAVADEKRRLADKAGQLQENMMNSARPPLAAAEALIRALPDLIFGDRDITGRVKDGVGTKDFGDSAGWTTGVIFN